MEEILDKTFTLLFFFEMCVKITPVLSKYTSLIDPKYMRTFELDACYDSPYFNNKSIIIWKEPLTRFDYYNAIF